MIFVIYLNELIDTLSKHGKTSSATITNYGDAIVNYIFIHTFTEGEFLNSYFYYFCPFMEVIKLLFRETILIIYLNDHQ